MHIPFIPTREAIERYQRLRRIGMELNHKIVKIIPEEAYDDIGDALGIRQNGVLIFDTEDMASVLMECCIYDWYKDGKNIVERFGEAHPPEPGTDEHYVLTADLHAKYRMLIVLSSIAGAGVSCRDVLNDEELFIMDIGLSQTAPPKMVIASRTIPFGAFWITTGAALPIHDTKKVEAALGSMTPELVDVPGAVELSLIRACIASGASDFVQYQSVTPKWSKRPLRPAWRRRKH